VRRKGKEKLMNATLSWLRMEPGACYSGLHYPQIMELSSKRWQPLCVPNFIYRQVQ
jgi:hypothetical protein